MPSLSFTVTHVREHIEATIEQEVKGKTTSLRLLKILIIVTTHEQQAEWERGSLYSFH